MKLEFFRHIFEKYSYAKFHGNPSSELFHADRKTDTLDEANCRIFLIFAKAPDNSI